MSKPLISAELWAVVAPLLPPEPPKPNLGWHASLAIGTAVGTMIQRFPPGNTAPLGFECASTEEGSMRSVLVRAGLVSLVTFLLLAQAGRAQDVSVANATPVGPADCTIEPRPVDELRALTLAGLPRLTASLPSTPVMTPLASPGPEPEVFPEVPADAAPFKAAQEIVRQIAACTNAGDIGALVSLYDDEGAAAYLAVGFVSFERAIPGSDATVNPALIDLYLGSLQLSAPLPEEVRISAYRVDSVTIQDDGLTYVVASFACGENAPSPFAFYLRNDDGRYHIVFNAPEDAQPYGTPIATTQP